MKKLELKNLKVKKLTTEEQLSTKGGLDTLRNPCDHSADMSCNQTSAWPIDCSSRGTRDCFLDF